MFTYSLSMVAAALWEPESTLGETQPVLR